MDRLTPLLLEYKASHLNKKNIDIHIVCVPLIFLSIVGILYNLNLFFLTSFLLLAYYLYLSNTNFTPLWQMLGLIILSWFSCSLLWKVFHQNSYFIYLFIFVASWIGQFIGHNIEGKKPSFFKDLQFLLIGPIFVLQEFLEKNKK